MQDSTEIMRGLRRKQIGLPQNGTADTVNKSNQNWI